MMYSDSDQFLHFPQYYFVRFSGVGVNKFSGLVSLLQHNVTFERTVLHTKCLPPLKKCISSFSPLKMLMLVLSLTIHLPMMILFCTCFLYIVPVIGNKSKEIKINLVLVFHLLHLPIPSLHRIDTMEAINFVSINSHFYFPYFIVITTSCIICPALFEFRHSFVC